MPYDIGPTAEWNRESQLIDHDLKIDHEALLDFLYYGSPFEDANMSLLEPAGIAEHPTVWQSRFVFERLGNVPESLGHTQHLERMVWSWNNWRWNFTYPGWHTPPPHPVYFDSLFSRFPSSEYWDAWKTVPYASAKIYVPGPCVLFVHAWARGTWNCVANKRGPAEKMWVFLANKDDSPVVFRLFIDQAHKPNVRPFQWKSNGLDYRANWSPIQTEQEIGLGSKNGFYTNVGREWMASTWPRGVIRVASEIFVPAAGYYTISLRYNSLHYYGWAEIIPPGPNFKWNSECAPLCAPDGDLDYPRWGMNLVSRWEASGIQAVAQLNRTGQASSDADPQFI
jgi:hypothetical protein